MPPSLHCTLQSLFSKIMHIIDMWLWSQIKKSCNDKFFRTITHGHMADLIDGWELVSVNTWVSYLCHEQSQCGATTSKTFSRPVCLYHGHDTDNLSNSHLVQRDLHCLRAPSLAPAWESGRGLSETTQKKCHHSENEVPAEEGLSPFSVSLCISTGVQLVADKTVGVIPGWAQLQLQLSSPCWPWVTRGFDDRLDLLCRSGLSRWGQQWMTMAGNIKPIEAGRQPYGVMGQTGQLSDECSCEHVDLLLCPFNSACHVSWCFLCLRIKTSLTFSTLEERSKHGQQMYHATNSDCTAMIMTSIPTCTVL